MNLSQIVSGEKAIQDIDTKILTLERMPSAC